MTTALCISGLICTVLALAAVRATRRPAVAVLGCCAVVFSSLLFAALDTYLVEPPGVSVARWGPQLTMLLLVLYGGGVAILLRERRVVATIAAAAAALVATVGTDAFVVEPRELEVTRTVILSDEANAPLRIALIADIQFDEFGSYERSALEQVMAEHPDVIVFAGDYVQAPAALRADQESRFRTALAEVGLAADLGVYAVRGHSETSTWPDLFREIGAITTPGTYELADGVSLTMLDLDESEDSSISLATPGGLDLVLGHSPDFALGHTNADLLLAGHTHGGQVSIPLYGPPVTLSRIPRDWASGLTELRNGQYLYVSRGIGMERGNAPRVRFLTRPELAIIDVVPETQR